MALCDKFITEAEYNSLSEAGKVLTDLTGVYSMNQGLHLFAEDHPVITASVLSW